MLVREKENRATVITIGPAPRTPHKPGRRPSNLLVMPWGKTITFCVETPEGRIGAKITRADFDALVGMIWGVS